MRPRRVSGSEPVDATPPREGRGLARVLRIHPRRRFEILEEISADVDSLEETLASRGVPRGRARAAALERLLPDDRVARQLEEGAVPYRRLEARLGTARLRAAERLALAAIASLTIVALLIGLVRLDAFRTGGGFVWALAAIVAAIAANTVRLAYGLWVRQDVSAAVRRRAWRLQMGLVLIAISVAGTGVGIAAWTAAGALAAEPDVVTGWRLVREVMSLASFGLGAVSLGLIGWIALTPSLRSYDTFERRIAALFAPPGTPRRITLHRSATEE
ncbi:MAG: hypothetical protein R3195_13950 [Gemmatimonadota bacterium]|nr:hypothetical protein [Gemmatimonadota bacterium]